MVNESIASEMEFKNVNTMDQFANFLLQKQQSIHKSYSSQEDNDEGANDNCEQDRDQQSYDDDDEEERESYQD